MTTRLFEVKGKTAKSLGNGVFEAKIIESGWGSSGYYSPELLKEYGPTTFRAGRASFANHPTEAEYENGRDVTKIMGRLVTDAEFREDNALWAQIKVKPEWVDFVEEYKDVIGLSIFAGGTVAEGEIDGRKGNIVESFNADDPYTSVDFVVAAGAGGKIERMLESFHAKEALQSDRREQLSNLVKDTYSGDKTYVWVRDFDDATNTVYFDVDDANGFAIFQQTYSVANDIVDALVDERTEVRVQTTYVPQNSSQTTENSAHAESHKENGMTPEEKADIVASVTAAVVEALKPVADDSDTAAVLEAVVEANLPKVARARVLEAVKNGTDFATAIESEKAYMEGILAENHVDDETPGVIRESEKTPVDLSIGAWK